MLSREPTIELHTLLQEADLDLADDEETKFIKDFPASRKIFRIKTPRPSIFSITTWLSSAM